MLLFDFYLIGNKLLEIRKQAGLTQSEVAERAGLSERTYADIERGKINMRTETILRICKALQITPNEILTESANPPATLCQNELFEQLNACSPQNRETALKLLSVYLDSLR